MGMAKLLFPATEPSIINVNLKCIPFQHRLEINLMVKSHILECRLQLYYYICSQFPTHTHFLRKA